VGASGYEVPSMRFGVIHAAHGAIKICFRRFWLATAAKVLPAGKNFNAAARCRKGGARQSAREGGISAAFSHPHALV
jgi:hypothetical protein